MECGTLENIAVKAVILGLWVTNLRSLHTVADVGPLRCCQMQSGLLCLPLELSIDVWTSVVRGGSRTVGRQAAIILLTTTDQQLTGDQWSADNGDGQISQWIQ